MESMILAVSTFLANNRKMDFDTIKKRLKIKGEEETKLLNNALISLEEDGLIYFDGIYYQVFDKSKLNKIQGTISVSKNGAGFVEVMDPKMGLIKYMIHARNMNGALDQDIVVLTDFENKHNDLIYASVDKIVKREKPKILFEYLGEGVFMPYHSKNKLAFILGEPDEYVPGDVVLATVDNNCIGYADDIPIFGAKINKYIGHKNEPGKDLEMIAHEFYFNTRFSDEALEEANNLPTIVEEADWAFDNDRVDLRDEVTFTIDGSHTKDIDDALSIKKEGEYFILTVSIADVTHYIHPGMALYEEAMNRGTSLYLVDTVIPMFPPKVSNGICSLNPNCDRFAISVKMKIDTNGKVVDYDYFESVIRSRKQMTYEDVNEILEKDEIPKGYEPFLEELNLLNELNPILEKAKVKRGAINFASSEIEVIVDENGVPISFEQRTQRTAEKIIENCMLLANETIAKAIACLDMPFSYRVHEAPDMLKFKNTIEYIRSYKLVPDSLLNKILEKALNEELRSYDLQNLLHELEGKPYYALISDMLLRSMNKAIYSTKNLGHYAVALRHYTHFTSPIRRLCDFTVHRLLKVYNTYENIEENVKDLGEICSHASYTERQAEKAEREAIKLKMAEYMEEHVGKVFKAKVVSCNPYGLVVTLDNNVKGYVAFKDVLDGFYIYGEQSHQLINKADRSKNYRIGDKIYVMVKEASREDRYVNFYASKEYIYENPKVKKYRREYKDSSK